ncbi:tetratricopeptide repeat protein [Halosquirtibacter laminarini]|uniref:Tetratricopeptide repeat protein n=1 Tax=Halosquirtibacter laminarini TaxID=3374600 RepID=A0AC61NND7_9BACT|nr:tetratricopeptide repeat protein [Prolixibacteraceae bacterium]
MFKNRFQIITVLWTISSIALFVRCGTTHNTTLSRRFQNMTSHYNVYFNGKQAYDEGLDRVKQSYVLDYSIPLPIFIEDIPEARNAGMANFKKAIAKADKLVKKHSIKVKPKKGSGDAAFMKRGEWNDWVDNATLLKADALYCQGKLDDAIFVYKALIQKYPYSEVIDRANLGIVRSYFAQEEEEEAIVILQKLEANKGLSKRVRRDISLVWANYHITKDNYSQAITRLEGALKFPSSGRDKRRYWYLLGQLYAEMGEKEKAAENYKKVLGLNTPYRMAFYAKIGIYELDNNGTELKKSKRILSRLLRDEKNEDFQDRIYFALGNIYWDHGEQDLAMEYYMKSVSFSSTNPTQRVESSLRLADIYFDQKQYRKSQCYYDTAVAVIQDSYPNAKEIRRKTKFLTVLTENLQIIETEDSLQNMASLPKEVLNEKINGWIKEERRRQREEMLRKEAEQKEMSNNDFIRNRTQSDLYRNNSRTGNSSSGGWYFYNPSTVATGKSNFQNIWGKRKLADNWRRTDKSKIDTEMNMQGEEQADDSQSEGAEEKEQKKEVVLTPIDRTYYTVNIPRGDSMLLASDHKIAGAAYRAARVYGEDLRDIPASLEMFDLYIRKTKDRALKLTALYYAYDIADKNGKTVEAQNYRRRILSEYPDSRVAAYLKDPTAFDELLAAKRMEEKQYADAVIALDRADYATAFDLSSKVLANPQDTTLVPKVAYIQMVSQGAQEGSIKLESLIKAYKTNYPNSPLMARVVKLEGLVAEQSLKDFATMVQNGYIHSEIQNGEEIQSEFENEKFEKTEETFYYYVLEVTANKVIDLNRLRFDVAHFNIDFFPEDDFDVDVEKLNEKRALVVVRNFPNRSFAKIYFDAIIHQSRVFASLNGAPFKNYVISSKNYRTVVEEKSSREYQKFFMANFSTHISDVVSQNRVSDPMALIKQMENEKRQTKPSGNFVAVDTESVVTQTEASSVQPESTTTSQTKEIGSEISSSEVTASQKSAPEKVNTMSTEEIIKQSQSIGIPEVAAAAVVTDKNTVSKEAPVAGVDSVSKPAVVPAPVPKDLFTKREDIRFVLMLVTDKEVRTVNKVRQQMMFVNIKDVKRRDLKVTAEDYDASHSLIFVRGLQNMADAKRYLEKLQQTQRMKDAVVPLIEDAWMISEENLRRLLKGKEMEYYRAFYIKEGYPVIKK